MKDARTIPITDSFFCLGLQRRVDQELRAEVAGQDQDRVAEVDRAALAVGEPAVVEHLEQDVEDLRVRLLDLVEQHDAVRPAPDRLGQLAALVVADVAGRRTDEPRDRVLLGVLAHVDADDRPLVVEEEVGQRLGQLGLAGAGRARGRGTTRSAGSGRRCRPASGVRRRSPRSRRRADRSGARRSPTPSPAAWRSRPAAAGRSGCRSRPRRRRRSARRRPRRRRACSGRPASASSTSAICFSSAGIDS